MSTHVLINERRKQHERVIGWKSRGGKKKFFSHHPLLSLLCSLCSLRFIHLAHLSRDKKDVQRPLRVMIQGQRAYRRGCNLMRQVRKEGEGGEQGLEVQRLGVIIGRSRWMWSQPLVNHALIPAALWCHTRLLLITVRASLRCQGFFLTFPGYWTWQREKEKSVCFISLSP